MRSNYQLVPKNNNSIICNVLKLDEGWRIQVFLPQAVRASDRLALLEWLQDYTAEIRSSHPYWLVNVNLTERVYFVDVIPTEGPEELIKHSVARLTGQQMAFEFAYA